jgi:hypothetical protein
MSLRDAKTYRPGVEWAMKNCRVERCPADGKSSGFDFDSDKDGVWWEGTGQMQVALRMLGERKSAADVLEAMRAGRGADGSMVAASKDGLTTGFVKEWGPWVYYRRPHVGATCWAIFAEMGWNPYWGEAIP